MTNTESRELLWKTFDELCKKENHYLAGYIANNSDNVGERYKLNDTIQDSFYKFAAAMDQKLI